MAAGTVDAHIQGELTGTSLGFWSVGLSAAYGFAAPTGALAGLASGLLGYHTATMFDDSGNRYMIGSLVGGIAGSGGAALMRRIVQGPSGAARYALKAAMFDASGAGVGYGYAKLAGYDDRTAVQYAYYGQMAAGIAGALSVKCFVPETLVHLPINHVEPSSGDGPETVLGCDWQPTTQSLLVTTLLIGTLVMLVCEDAHGCNQRSPLADRKLHQALIDQSLIEEDGQWLESAELLWS